MAGRPDAAEARPAPVPRILFAVVAPFRRFFRTQAAGGIVLIAASVLAMVWANSGWRGAYDAIFHAHLDVTLAGRGIQWPVHHWINDALMTVFFLTAGLEIKRELSIGELRTARRAALPLVAAAGGMAAPAAIYLALNAGATARGWAIPAATDIAFALGCLSLVRSRVPPSLFVFLTALAIFDDLGAILVIAFFYSGALDVPALIGAAVVTAALFALGRAGVQRVWPYLLLGGILWAVILRSGLHATLAGVIMGLAVPARPRQSQASVLGDLDDAIDSLRHGRGGDGAIAAIERHLEAVQAPVERMLHVLHAPVAFVVVPLFALANAGVSVSGDVGRMVTSPVALGVGVGLVAGKTVGVLGATAVSVKLGLAPMPTGARWGQVLGVAIMAGIGFTMSLFIAQLAFVDAPAQVDEAKVGILAASLVAACLGSLVLRFAGPVLAPDAAEEDEKVVVRSARYVEGLETVRVVIPRVAAGQSVASLDVRRRWGVQVLGVWPAGDGADGGAIRLRPVDPARPLDADDELLVLGRQEDVRGFQAAMEIPPPAGSGPEHAGAARAPGSPVV